ncbi:hypothetical protein L198_04103 [Cryptococcus wingfieldii CBS 7118]|uniref:Uncharacterized protein n=1 Tax=Cryptococcus wingfieldii CBS 7118 TaxID=1295528 RepID=A0A1E3J697_9TREE|nr:hypothetical protein L198_04103 [Cryptococcus wingfieldii CBS 7118]ODN96389.1 hypothetical protein L198_04103 [Cryptococcus wingfieldii CBS 7118]
MSNHEDPQPQEDSSFPYPESRLDHPSHKRPKTVSPLGLQTAAAALPPMSAPQSPFYPSMPSAGSPLPGGPPGPYDAAFSTHPSPSSPYIQHHPSPFPPHAAMYSPFPGSHLAAPGALDVHSFSPHTYPSGGAAGPSDYRSFSAPVGRHHPAPPSTSASSGENTNSPSPSFESANIDPGLRMSHAGKAPGMTINKGKHKGTPGPKARIPRDAKVMIAEHIIAKGVAMANVDELSRLTGLTRQQIKSQLVDNRQNVRKQLVEAIRSLQ